MKPTVTGGLGKFPSLQVNHPTYPLAGPASPIVDYSRRTNQAGAAAPQSMPRRGRASRKQHRNQRRPIPGDRGDSVIEEEVAMMSEFRQVRNSSGRRGQTDITHLLNYSAPFPHSHRGEHDQHSTRSYRRPLWGPGSGYHAADKARYVHANYRFIVSPQGAYPSQAADPDVFADWSDVMQVLASPESQAASCPICLSEPVAPRMSKCGHIFCLPCLIRFMHAATDEEPRLGRGSRWRKCPICEDSIYLNDVRPVRFYVGQESPLPRVGDDIVLRLMARKASSTLALPWGGGLEALNSGDDVPWHFAANVLDYAHIMKGSPQYMMDQFQEEKEALEQQAREDELLFGEDRQWTQKAINEVCSAKEKLRLDAIEDKEGQAALVEGKANCTPHSNAAKQSAVSPDFFFFSALPQLYLSPLDIRILKTTFGSFSMFPSTLLPRVEHISNGHVVDDGLRKRAKYLGHLPQGCVVSFLECDWTDIVPAEVLETFSSEIKRRRNRHRDKAAQEERERVQSERIEAAALRNLTGSGSGSGSRRTASPRPVEASPPPIDPLDFNFLVGGSSAGSPPDARPGFSTLASMSTSPSTQKTVWGTYAMAQSPPTEPTEPQPSVDDGWLKEEDYLSLGPAELAVQLEAMSTAAEGEDGPSSSSAGDRGGNKKKKKQKITLMSTGGRRGV